MNSALLRFIKEARKRGFDDSEIKQPLLSAGWDLKSIEEAFTSLKTRPKFKNRITLYLDSDVLHVLEKRAKRNMFTLSEQLEDIIRRSVINATKRTFKPEKLDDLLIGLFSRRRRT